MWLTKRGTANRSIGKGKHCWRHESVQRIFILEFYDQHLNIL